MFSKAILQMPASRATNYFGTAKGDIVDFSLGEPRDMPPESVINAYAASVRDGNNQYAPVPGLPGLRSAVAQKLDVKNRIPAIPDEVIITSGASEAISLSILSLVDPGDEVILIDPNYPVTPSMVHFCGAKPVSILLSEENNFTPDIEKIKQSITKKTKMLVINTPHNPTGTVFGEKSLKAISEIFGGTILADEVYENFTYGTKHCSLASFADDPGRIITINSFSKTYAMCGYRAGYLHASKELVQQMLKLKLCLSTCTSRPCQTAAIAALEDEEFPNIMKQRFGERKNLMVAGLKAIGLPFVEPKGAFYVFSNVEELGGDEAAFERFKNAGVLTMPGRVFHEDCKNYLRFSFAAPAEEIKKGIGRIESI